MTQNYDGLPTPCYVLESAKLRQNLALLDQVQQRAGVTIILALKGFAMWSAFPMVAEVLSGCSASSYNEARLAREKFGGHVHLYAPAYTEEEFPSLLELSDRISFNSLTQWQRFAAQAQSAGISCGLRVNPLINEVETDLYNPCGPNSRLGVLPSELEELPGGIEGLHAHALCECGAESSARLIDAIEQHYGRFLPRLKWLNLGGGHLITRQGYDVDLLVNRLLELRERYPNLDVVLEPGSAIAWQTGPLISRVLDIIERGETRLAILDTSATAHMPDTLEMPYRAEIRGAGMPGEKPYTYRLGGLTCLAGDVIGDYSFDQPLQLSDLLVFEDMIHYTMVKTTMFNGVQHPAIAILEESGEARIVRQFGYADFASRLS